MDPTNDALGWIIGLGLEAFAFALVVYATLTILAECVVLAVIKLEEWLKNRETR